MEHIRRSRSNALVRTGEHGYELSLAAKLLEDAYGEVAAHHGKWHIRLHHNNMHLVNKQIEYGVKHKWHNEKGLTLLGAGISGGIMVTSMVGAGVITGTTHGVATPLALAGLAAGTWAANQVADAVTDVVRNKYRRKRMGAWLTKYPAARQQIESEGEQLLLIQDACDSIRRAVDHYRKAADSAQKLAAAISESEMGRFTNCSELTTVVKRQMKFSHELRKTELYLVPCIDLAILLKNTQLKMCEAWSEVVPSAQKQIGKYLMDGDHSKCDKTCYGALGGRSAVPRRPLKPGPAEIPDGLVHFGKRATELQSEIDFLVALRNLRVADMQLPPKQAPDVGHPVQHRFDALLADAARYYDKPGTARRTRNYIKNAWTRRTAGELLTGFTNRSFNLMVGVGSSYVGSVVNTGTIAPLVVAPISDALVQQLRASAFNVTTMGLFDGAIKVVSDRVAGATGSAIMGAGKAGVGLANTATKLAYGVFINKFVDQVGSRPNEDNLTASGKNAGDNLFKKSVRHLQQAMDAYQAVVLAAYPVDACKDALEFGSKTAEFVWHLGKSIDYLNHALRLVEFMAMGMEEWDRQEYELWHAIETASLQYLHSGCDYCACEGKATFGACYGPGKRPDQPLRPLRNL